MWERGIKNSSKLNFYASVKKRVSYEKYLGINNREVRKSVARLRSSSHRLNVETARYLSSKPRSKLGLQSNNKKWNQSCKVCCNTNTELLQELPFAEQPIVEDEQHVLVTCPAYHHLRGQVNDHILSSLLAWDERLPTIFEEPFVHELGLYVHRIFQIRFPKKSSKKETESTANKTRRS